jgi:hypothetical protein
MSDNPYDYEYKNRTLSSEISNIEDPTHISRINFMTNNGWEGNNVNNGQIELKKKPRVLFHNVGSEKFYIFIFTR